MSRKIVVICDVCKKEGDDEEMTPVGVPNAINGVSRKMDVCESCSERPLSEIMEALITLLDDEDDDDDPPSVSARDAG